MDEDFGAFSPLFEKSGGYLALLHLGGGAEEVKRVKECVQSAVDAQRDVVALLQDLNWRPTLVACVAALFMKGDETVVATLWNRLDSGSWVVPQIAVTLARVDPKFMTNARARLLAHCPVNGSVLRGMTVSERHSAAGPAGLVGRSAKAASALVWLVGRMMTPPHEEWFERLRASAEHRALVAEDVDGGGRIAERWERRLTEILAAMELADDVGPQLSS
ncbi:hypothetical protein [Prosthecobacter sp.]|uniref:hypothetical protein n=1 Tax=Prosthecobacter sp. TaxID=1965333 RepID=UPI0037849F46